MTELKYPEWQNPWIDAMSEVDAEEIPPKIEAFERIADQRLREIDQSLDHWEEREAIIRAITLMKKLRGDRLRLVRRHQVERREKTHNWNDDLRP